MEQGGHGGTEPPPARAEPLQGAGLLHLSTPGARVPPQSTVTKTTPCGAGGTKGTVPAAGTRLRGARTSPSAAPLQGPRHRSPRHWGAVQWGSPTPNPPSFPSAPQPRHSRDEQRSAPRTQGCERCSPRQPPAPSPAPSPQPRPSPLRWRWRRVLPDKGRGTAMGSRLRVVYGLLPVIN